MGIDITGAVFILDSLTQTKQKNNFLMVGRQGIHLPIDILKKILSIHGIDSNNSFSNPYADDLCYELGFKNVDSIDYSSYEGANILHDMNLPISDNLKNKYDFIFDGGAAEHVFNTPQYFQNIIDLLSTDGIYCVVTCNNNFSGHGFYQFSPELFNRMFCDSYGMILLKSALCEAGQPNWAVLPKPDQVIFRDESKLNTNHPVYILACAKKIKNVDITLLSQPPQQYNYQQLQWK